MPPQPCGKSRERVSFVAAAEIEKGDGHLRVATPRRDRESIILSQAVGYSDPRQDRKMNQLQLRIDGRTDTSPDRDLASIIHQCYQCGKCSAGCPVATEMDLLPHQMVRLAVLGDRDKIIESRSIWICLTCHTCGARCPNGIDVPALLDPIRHQVVKDNVATAEQQVPEFHKAFLKTVRMFGRVHELSLIGIYKMKTKSFFEDMKLGWEMFRRGKIHILPDRSRRRGEVKAIFKKSSLK